MAAENEDFTMPLRIQQFISLIKQQPAVWNSNAACYKDKFIKQESWAHIMNELYPDYKTWDNPAKRMLYTKKVMKKWTQIRDSYVKSDKRRRNLTEDQLLKHRPYLYSEMLTFLQPVINDTKKKNKIKFDTDSETETDDSESLETENDQIDTTSDQIDTTNIKVEFEPIEYVTVPTVPRKRPRSSSSDAATNVNVTMTEKDSSEAHMSFFHGITPLVQSFDVDQVLEFQMGVLKLIKQIRNNK